MDENNVTGAILEAFAKSGTIGNNAGVTTPVVLEKNDINPPITAITTGTIDAGRAELTTLAIIPTVPALIATDINIPIPQIIINVPHGTFFTMSFSFPNFINRPITAKMIDTNPTSIDLSIALRK